MIKIRPQHLEALRLAADRRFHATLLAHLRREYPEETASVGPERLRAFVADGCARARDEYGLARQRDQARFVELALALGPGFDQDPELPWAGPALRDASRSPEERMALVWFAAMGAADDEAEADGQA